jgi:hypothetical protein
MKITLPQIFAVHQITSMQSWQAEQTQHYNYQVVNVSSKIGLT